MHRGALRDPAVVSLDHRVAEGSPQNLLCCLGDGPLIARNVLDLRGRHAQGICAIDLLIVADRGNHRIVCFNNEGEKVFDFGKRGRAPEDFSSPADVATHGNRIFVLDTGNNRVQVFELQMKIE